MKKVRRNDWNQRKGSLTFPTKTRQDFKRIVHTILNKSLNIHVCPQSLNYKNKRNGVEN